MQLGRERERERNVFPWILYARFVNVEHVVIVSFYFLTVFPFIFVSLSLWITSRLPLNQWVHHRWLVVLNVYQEKPVIVLACRLFFVMIASDVQRSGCSGGDGGGGGGGSRNRSEVKPVLNLSIGHHFETSTGQCLLHSLDCVCAFWFVFFFFSVRVRVWL